MKKENLTFESSIWVKSLRTHFFQKLCAPPQEVSFIYGYNRKLQKREPLKLSIVRSEKTSL